MTNIDYQSADIVRKVDKKSISNVKLIDKARSFFFRLFKDMNCGKNVIFKKNVVISISTGGKLSIGDNCLFHQGVLLLLTLPNPSVTIGKSVFFGKDTIIASKNKISIGNFTIFAPRCYVIDHEHGFEPHDLILNQHSSLKSVEIGHDCYFGTGSIVLGGVKVGNGSIVGAGSVVTTNIPPGEVWAGIPAKFIKKR